MPSSPANLSAVTPEGDDRNVSTNSGGDAENPLLIPGTWLGDVPRVLTLNVASRINLLIGGLNRVRNHILIGVDADGNEPEPGRPRADTTAETAKAALDDLITLRDIISTTIHAVAAAAITAGVDSDTATAWAHYDTDDQALNEGIDTILNHIVNTREYAE